LALVSCTVTNNVVGLYAYGGGLFSDDNGEPLVKNSIFADNSAPSSGQGPDIYGPVRSADYNLIEDLGGATLTGSTDNHVPPGQDPVLGGLIDNGGETRTHALQTGSPAIDTGSCRDIAGVAIGADQRGVVRPQGPRCDIGAYEFPQPGLTLDKDVDDATPEPGQRIIYTLVVHNHGAADATGGTISDTLPFGLSLAGTITLEPATAGLPGSLPTLITDLTVMAGRQVTVTFPVTVSASLPTPTGITNVAAVTSDEVPVPETGSRTIVVVGGLWRSVYLPMVGRAFQ
jgi:uncharacterized repeat protein (TIGR01451 family)